MVYNLNMRNNNAKIRWATSVQKTTVPRTHNEISGKSVHVGQFGESGEAYAEYFGSKIVSNI